MSALELGRLFSLMEGVDPEGLFNAALRAAGGDLGGAGSLAAQLPPQGLQGMQGMQGMEGLASHLDDGGGGGGGMKSGASPSGELQEGGGSTDDDSKGSVGGTGSGAPSVPPRTGSINDRKCTKVLPASSSAPKYKFVVPNEYVYKFMKHLVERPFHMRDMGGKLWDCVLIQRKNKEKYEYMIQGWRRFGEATGVQEGDTVTIEMVDSTILQLTLERTSGKKGARGGGGGGSKIPSSSGLGGGGGSGGTGPLPVPTLGPGSGPGPGPAPQQQQQQQHSAFTDRQQQQMMAAAQLQASMQQAAAVASVERQQAAEAEQRQAEQRQAEQQQQQAQQQHGMPPSLAAQQQQVVGGGQQQQGGPPALGMQAVQQQAAAAAQLGLLGGDPSGGAGGGAGPQGLLALIQQQQQAQQQLGMMAAAGPGGGGGPPQQGTPQPVLTPRSLSQHLANGLSGPLSNLQQLTAAGGINEAQLADLTAVINQLEKRQRVGEGPPGGVLAAGGGGGPGGPGSGTGAIRLLSDVADLDTLMQENMGLREELRIAQAKVAGLETGVLNIKSVLTRNTDPGLIAMTGVINLLNQMESPDFLPELNTMSRMQLTGLCSEVRRHLNGVLRMVWILRSLPDDVQQHNLGGGPGGGSNGGP